MHVKPKGPLRIPSPSLPHIIRPQDWLDGKELAHQGRLERIMKVTKVTASLPTTKQNWAKYHFDDGSVVKVVYSPEFGESQPEGPCSQEQAQAIFAYMDGER